MANYIGAEKSEVWTVPAISNTSAPTAAEMNAGVRLTTFIRSDVTTDFSGNLVENGTLASAFNSTVAGTYGGGLNTLTSVLRNNTADTAWDALPRGTAPYLAVQSGVSTGTSWASGDVIDQLYAIEVVARKPTLSRDGLVTFDADFAITTDPVYGATVT
jgi:hypothetical protein